MSLQNELQNAFAMSRLETELRDSKISELVSAGRFVVVVNTPAYCSRTDAILGEYENYESDFGDIEAAYAEVGRLNAQDLCDETYFTVEPTRRQMSKYEQFSQKDFEDFLGVNSKGKPKPNAVWRFHRMELEGTNELVYGLRVGKNLTLRVYSTIEGGVARNCGSDAIRCVLFWRNKEGKSKIIGMQKKVLRVKNWRDNLKSRIDNWEDMKGPNCPKCLSPTVKRKNKVNKNEFFGCCNYPNCRGIARS